MLWRTLVAILGLGNLAFGALSLTAPLRIAAFIGLEPSGAAARGELRAVFGGLVLVLGGLMLAALRHPDGRAWLQALALGFAGLALGRLVSLAADGVETYTLLGFLLESASAVILAIGSRHAVASAATGPGSPASD